MKTTISAGAVAAVAGAAMGHSFESANSAAGAASRGVDLAAVQETLAAFGDSISGGQVAALGSALNAASGSRAPATLHGSMHAELEANFNTLRALLNETDGSFNAIPTGAGRIEGGSDAIQDRGSTSDAGLGLFGPLANASLQAQTDPLDTRYKSFEPHPRTNDGPLPPSVRKQLQALNKEAEQLLAKADVRVDRGAYLIDRLSTPDTLVRIIEAFNSEKDHDPTAHSRLVHRLQELAQPPEPAEPFRRRVYAEIAELRNNVFQIFSKRGYLSDPRPAPRGAAQTAATTEAASDPGTPGFAISDVDLTALYRLDVCPQIFAELARFGGLHGLGLWGEGADCGPLSPCTGDLTNTQYGRALYFPNSPLNDAEPEEVCMTDLGGYNDNWEFVEPNQGFASGRYVQTINDDVTDRGATDFPEVLNLRQEDNDFRMNPFCYNEPVPEGETPCPEGILAREATLWGSQLAGYHGTTDFRNRIMNPAIEAANIDAESFQWLMEDQKRASLCGDFCFRPVLIEAVEAFESSIFNTGIGSGSVSKNFVWTFPIEREVGEAALSIALDPGLVVGEYAQLLSNYLPTYEEGFKGMEGSFFGFNQSWQTTIGGALGDSHELVAAYLYLEEAEVHRYAYFTARKLLEDYWERDRPACRDPDVNPESTNYDCDKAMTLRNVMMANSAEPIENEFYKRGVFPFFPRGYDIFDGPTGEDLAAFMPSAIWYDISNEFGLGDEKMYPLLIKTYDMIDDPRDNLNIHEFGELILAAAAELWPDLSNPDQSIYHEGLKDLMVSRGLDIGGVYFQEQLTPAVVPDSKDVVYDEITDNALRSFHPMIQSEYTGFNGNVRGSTTARWEDPTDEIHYRSLRFDKYSRNGPCDRAFFMEADVGNTWATAWVPPFDNAFGPDNLPPEQFQAIPNPDEDANIFFEMSPDKGTDRPGNLSLFVPGDAVGVFNHSRRCQTDRDGYYAEDQRALGWKIVDSMPNGFAIEVVSSIEFGSSFLHHIQIVDPSADADHPYFVGASTYDWSIRDYHGEELTGQISGQGGDHVFAVWLPKDEPVVISITRNRDGEQYEIEEPSNRLGRKLGVDEMNPFLINPL